MLWGRREELLLRWQTEVTRSPVPFWLIVGVVRKGLDIDAAWTPEGAGSFCHMEPQIL